MKKIKNYNNRIYNLKKLYIIAIVLLIAVLILLTRSNEDNVDKGDYNDVQSQFKKDYDVGVDAIRKSEISIKNLVFEGINDSQLPYKIIANDAVKYSNGNYLVDEIKAWYNLIDNSNLMIISNKGIIDEEKKHMMLKDNIRLEYNDYTLNAKNIIIDLQKSNIASKDTIVVNGDNIKITADSFNTTNNNQEINFEGNVRAVFDLHDFNNNK